MASPHPHLAGFLRRFEQFPPGLTADEKTFHATFNMVYVLAVSCHLLYAILLLWLGEMGILALNLAMLIVDLVCLQLHRARRERADTFTLIVLNHGFTSRVNAFGITIIL